VDGIEQFIGSLLNSGIEGIGFECLSDLLGEESHKA